MIQPLTGAQQTILNPLYTNNIHVQLPLNDRISKLAVAPQPWNQNHIYGTGLIGTGVTKKSLRPKLGELPGYSAYMPAT